MPWRALSWVRNSRWVMPPTSRAGALSARLLIVTSALPYLALPLGSSTNLPLSTVLAGWLLLRNAHRVRLMAYTALLLLLPLLAAGLRMFFSPEPFSIAGQLTWMLYSLPLPAMAVAVLVLREKLLPWLAWTITASAGIALLQKFLYLDRGVVPWLWAYDAPGYASVRELAPLLAEYVRRPFGLFPESSFMAGTLAMMVTGLIVIERRFSGTVGRAGLLAALCACAAIAVSGSGTSLVALCLILAALLGPLALRRPTVAIFLLPPVVLAACWFGIISLSARTGSFNWSWADRTASLVGSMRLLFSDPTILLLGIGRGQSTVYFSENRVPLLGLERYNQLSDIFSVLGRIVLENGVLFGLPLVLIMALLIGSGGVSRRPLENLVALAALGCWLIAAGVAISYDSAFWIFGLPGLFLGLRLLDPVAKTSRTSAAATAGSDPGTTTSLPPEEKNAYPAYR